MADNRKAVIDIEINGVKAGDTIKSLNAQLSAARKELNNLPIGTKEWAAALDNVNQKAAALDGVKNRMAETAKASSQLRSEIQSQIPLFGQFQGLSDKITLVRTATTGSITAMNLLKVAMAAVPIFALIAAFASLITWFKKTDDGARTLDGILKAVNNTMDVLLNRVLNIGETLKGLFTNPVQFFKDFSKDVAEATKAGIEFANMTDDIDEKQRKLDLANSEREKQITRLILQSKNRSISEKERIDFLEQASALETISMNETIALQDQKIKLLEKEAKRYEDNFQKNDELEDKLNDARIERNRLESESLNLKERLKNREDALLDASGKKEEAANAKRKKDAEALAKELADLEKYIQDTRIAIITDAQTKEMALLDAKFEQEYAKYGEDQNALNLMVELYHQEKLAIDKKYADIKKANDKKAFEDQLNELSLGQQLLQEQTKTNYLQGTISKEEYENTLFNLEYSAESKKLELLKSSGKATELEIQQQANKVLQITQNKNAARLENERKTAQAIGTVASSLGGFVSTVMSIGQENYAAMTEQQKVAAGIQIAINTATGIAGLVAAGAADASSITWFERVGKVIASAGIVLAGIAGATNLLASAGTPSSANIQSTPASPGFAQGGYTPDVGKYTPAGVVHGGEWVAPQWMVNSPNFSGVISMLEISRKQGFATGGGVDSNQNQSNPSMAFPTQFRLHPDDLDALATKINNKKVELNWTYFQLEQDKLNLIKSQA